MSSEGETPPYDNLLHMRQDMNNAFKDTHGETCYYLAYTYMRSGKIKYAIEEARAAVTIFESLSYDKVKDQKLQDRLIDTKHIKLRHAWGLVAVVALRMGNSAEAKKESQHALAMVRQYDIGPLEGIYLMNRARVD